MLIPRFLKHRGNVIHRGMSTLTPEEAGRRAEEMAQRYQTGNTEVNLETHLAHAGVLTHEHNAAMSPPLHMATTYARPASGPYQEGDSVYSRMDNPTRLLLEREIARLECLGREAAAAHETEITCAFASGLMAASSIVLSHRTPLFVLLPNDLYHGVSSALHHIFTRFQVQVEHADMTNVATMEDALQNIPAECDKIVWIESPSNPLCQVVDIQAICQAVDRYQTKKSDFQVTTVVDSTLAPPTITQPLHFGADIVMHSGTKYLAGHSDALLGVVTCSPWTERGRQLAPILQQVQILVGGVASTMDSWLTLRGLRTLATRVDRQCRSAMQVATYLQDHPGIEQLHYPGLKTHAHHQVAQRQMKGGYGGVLSVELATESRAMAFAGALRTIQRATSLGGTETLIEHRASIEPPERVVSPAGLLRISVGLEDASDLIADLKNALEIADRIHREHKME